MRALQIAVLGFGALSLLNPAFAAPPGRQHEQHLDLRAPDPREAGANAAENNSRAFPSMSHRRNLGSRQELQLPALGADGMRSRSSVQEFVRRVHQEGLPAARLFETKSALLHLGLSPRGKPGLWLVQKTH
jgi:hypothetical protein